MPYDGPYPTDAKIRWWTTPIPPEICAQSDPPLQKTPISIDFA